MVSRLCLVPGVMGGPHGTEAIRPAPYLRLSTSVHCCLLWNDCLDDVLCGWGAFNLFFPHVTPCSFKPPVIDRSSKECCCCMTAACLPRLEVVFPSQPRLSQTRTVQFASRDEKCPLYRPSGLVTPGWFQLRELLSFPSSHTSLFYL